VRTALSNPNPTVIFSHAKLLGIEWEMPENSAPIPFGKADVKRTGGDVTIVATSLMVHRALDAASLLAARGIEAEVIDPRTLVPFDEETILRSVRKTGRLIVVDEAPLRAGAASEIAASVAEKAFNQLKTAPVRIARNDSPVPFSPTLESEVVPTAATIVDAALGMIGSLQRVGA
jgi:acetoin:2,6-dichlorophenolindophenol oxidoreductase subunit beta